MLLCMPMKMIIVGPNLMVNCRSAKTNILLNGAIIANVLLNILSCKPIPDNFLGRK